MAVATKPGHPPINTSAFAAIRNAEGGVTQGGLAGEAPTVVVREPHTRRRTPCLFSNTVFGAGAITIRGRASASSGRTITRMEMVVDGQGGPVFLRDTNVRCGPRGLPRLHGWQYQRDLRLPVAHRSGGHLGRSVRPGRVPDRADHGLRRHGPTGLASAAVPRRQLPAGRARRTDADRHPFGVRPHGQDRRGARRSTGRTLRRSTRSHW